MSGWGLSVTGLDETLRLLEQVQAFWDEETGQAYVVAPTVSYAIHQESGTSNIEARPFMAPAAERVNANPETMLARYDTAAPDAGPVETLAIAVQNEAKRIADRKDVRDTGTLIASITYEEP